MALDLLEKRFTDLQDRLNVLQDATDELQDLINRLANLDFQPGSVPLGATDDDNVGSELSSEINQILREQEEELELLQEEIIDVPTGKSGNALQHDKDRLKDGAKRLEHELQLCRKSFRKAQITAKQNLQTAQRQERELLYASFSAPRSSPSSPVPEASVSAAAAPFPRRRHQPASEMSKEEQMISASHDVTQSLRRTHDMMAAELAKSDFAHNALKESTETLAQLSDNYSSLDTMLSSSRALLGTLLKSQKTDTWYLQSAFYLLVITVAWLIFRRLLWGPLWWLVWLPMKLMFKTAVGVSNTVGPRSSQIPLNSETSLMSSSTQSAYMNNEDAPTIQVGTPATESKAAQQNDSALEQIGEMINEPQNGSTDLEAEIKEETVLRERKTEERPNPKKRMMEEEAAAGDVVMDDQRPKDEL